MKSWAEKRKRQIIQKGKKIIKMLIFFLLLLQATQSVFVSNPRMADKIVTKQTKLNCVGGHTCHPSLAFDIVGFEEISLDKSKHKGSSQGWPYLCNCPTPEKGWGWYLSALASHTDLDISKHASVNHPRCNLRSKVLFQENYVLTKRCDYEPPAFWSRVDGLKLQLEACTC